MRVLIVNSVCGFGSTGKISVELYNLLKDNGHECCIAFGRGKSKPEIDTYKIGNSFDNYWHVLETRLLDNHGFASRLATIKFIHFIEQYDPDIINLHNLHGYYLNIKILFKFLKKSRAKIVWTLHDGWVFSGHSPHPDIDEKGNLLKNRNEKYEYPKAFISRSRLNIDRKEKYIKACNNISFITPSKWLAEICSKTYLSQFPISVINNGIDLTNFYPDIDSLTSEKTCLLGVANVWNNLKGLQIFEELAENLDSKKYQITLIGKCDSKDSSSITYIDRTESIDQLRKLYSSADYLINPTFQDTFPTVNIESIACGTPVITFNTGGSPEVLDEKSGIVTDTKTSISIMDSLRTKSRFVKEDCVDRARKFDKNDKFKEYLEYFLIILDTQEGRY